MEFMPIMPGLDGLILATIGFTQSGISADGFRFEITKCEIYTPSDDIHHTLDGIKLSIVLEFNGRNIDFIVEWIDDTEQSLLNTCSPFGKSNFNVVPILSGESAHLNTIFKNTFTKKGLCLLTQFDLIEYLVAFVRECSTCTKMCKRTFDKIEFGKLTDGSDIPICVLLYYSDFQKKAPKKMNNSLSECWYSRRCKDCPRPGCKFLHKFSFLNKDGELVLRKEAIVCVGGGGGGGVGGGGGGDCCGGGCVGGEPDEEAI